MSFKLYAESLTFDLNLKPGNASDALNFIEIGTQILKGHTLVREHERFQKQTRSVFIAFSDHFERKKSLKMEVGEKDLYYRYVITIDEREDVTLKEMDSGNYGILLKMVWYVNFL